MKRVGPGRFYRWLEGPIRDVNAIVSRRVPKEQASALIKQIEQLPPEVRHERLLNFVRGEVATVLGLDGV